MKEPIRIILEDGSGVSVGVEDGHVTLLVRDNELACVAVEASKATEIRDALSAAIATLQPTPAPTYERLHSPAAQAIAQELVRIHLALAELKKYSPAEYAALYEVEYEHCKAAHPAVRMVSAVAP